MNEQKKCAPSSCRLFIAGNIEIAKSVCGQYCREIGWCVTVTPTDYIYSGGQESGMIIEAINYPRFPTSEIGIYSKMYDLAKILVVELNQKSYTIMDSEDSCYFTVDMPFQENNK